MATTPVHVRTQQRHVERGNNCLASAGAITVALPDLVQQTVSGFGGRTYVLLACANDTKLIAERNDPNNCRTSGTAVVVTP